MTAAGDKLVLYRGESISERRSDQERVAWVKKFHRTGEGLWTNLANMGNPYALDQLGLPEAVQRHVAELARFPKTHFLSFTTLEDVALRYARTPPVEDESAIDMAHYPDHEWRYTKYAIFKFNVFKRERLSDGVYRIRYNSDANLAIVVNAEEYLATFSADVKGGATYQEALALARRDKEWLVLPADTIKDGTLSALLQKGSDLDVDHYVDTAFFIDHR